MVLFPTTVKRRDIKIRANSAFTVEKTTGEVFPGFGLYPGELVVLSGPSWH